MDPAAARRAVLDASRSHQLQLHPKALAALTTFVAKEASQRPAPAIVAAVFACLSEVVSASGSRLVTLEAVVAAVERYQLVAGHSTPSSAASAALHTQVVPLTKVPTVSWDAHSGVVSVAAHAPPDRRHALQQRYLCALWRCHRCGYYKKGAATGAVTGPEDSRPCLVPISSLEGLPEHLHTAVLGALHYAPVGGSGTAVSGVGPAGEASWVLEDPRASIPLVFPRGIAHALAHLVAFVVRGALVVAVGRWSPHGYVVDRLELPPAEGRDVTLRAMGHADTFGLAPHDTARARAQEAQSTADVIVFCAHVHLDEPSVLYALSRMMAQLRAKPDDELAAMTFVLAGEFSAAPVCETDIAHGQPEGPTGGGAGPVQGPVQGRAAFAALFEQLGATIASAAPNVAQHAHFILVPGPRDLTALRGVLPQPGLPASAIAGLVRRCPHVELAPNPCRLRHYTKEIVVARSDFYHLLQADSLQQCAGVAAAPAQPFEHVVKTVLDQAHLFPVVGGAFRPSSARRPQAVDALLWQHDNALALTPLPHFLVMCDRTEQWECTHAGCTVFNPGSFASTTSFVWFSPSDGDITFNSVS